MNWKPWLKGLSAAFIVGATTAIAAGAVGVRDFRSLGGLLAVGVVAGILAACLYLSKSPLPVVIVVLAALSVPAVAQVNVSYSPEPMAVLRTLHVKNIGLWSVRACNDGTGTAVLSPERFYMAAPTVHWVEPLRAQAVITDARQHSFAGKALSLLTYGGILATGFTGFGAVAASTETVASIASATFVADKVKQQIQTDLPALGPFTGSLLTAPVTLAPAACGTWTAFAGKMPKPQTVTATIAYDANRP